MFKKEILPAPVRETGKIASPYGEIAIDEWQDHFRFRFNDDGPCFFVGVEGDLLKISFNLIGVMCLEKHLSCALWLLTSAEVAEMVNPKFGNKPELRFTAALFATTGKGRSCVLLPSDTVEAAIQRFGDVWYKQAPIAGYGGKLATYLEP